MNDSSSLRSSDPALEQILHVVRGEAAEIYRVRLRPDGAAELERFENGAFGAARVFRGDGAEGFDAGRTNGARKLDCAVRYITSYLDGSANVGERDLLSPTSALARNVRWFPGDIQMINTAFHYVPELFPSAQFHVTQLFRRVFGDVAFLALMIATSAHWLQTGAPVTLRALAIALQVLAIVAIVGFDRVWEPIRHRFRKSTAILARGGGLRVVLLAPGIVLSQLVTGLLSAALATLIGLANLAINPLRIFESWRRVARGQALEWKASSVSAAQDMRGWPLGEFRDVYRPATIAGVTIACGALWLVTLGAPLDLLGVNGLGVFVASFLTAAFYAWYSALPHSEHDGTPQYRLRLIESSSLVAVGALGIVLSGAALRFALYPLPAFEGSIGYVALFLTASAALALVYPLYYSVKRTVFSHLPSRGGGPLRAVFQASLPLLIAATLLTLFWSVEPGSAAWRDPLAAFRVDRARWRMPVEEQAVYTDVGSALRSHRKIDPEPLLRAEGDQATLRALPDTRMPDLKDLSGVPSPRLPRLARLDTFPVPELYSLPEHERVSLGKPKREFVLPVAEIAARAPLPGKADRKAHEDAIRLVSAMTPRALAPAEAAAEDAFIEHADYPWQSRDALRALGKPDARGDRVSLVEMARVFRWDDVRDLWDRVPSAQRDGPPDRVRLQRLTRGIEGVTALGRDPTADQVMRFLDEELALADDWSRLYPRVPFASLDTGPGARSRFFGITQFLLALNESREKLARDLRLDYVNAYWDAPLEGTSLHRIFDDRPRVEPWEQLELDFGDNSLALARWNQLETEQAVASRVWQAASASPDLPSVEQLRRVAGLLDGIVHDFLSSKHSPLTKTFGELFRLEGVDDRAVARDDVVAAVLKSRLFARTMAGRVGRVVGKAVLGEAPPLSSDDRHLLQTVARDRYGELPSDPTESLLYEWLVLTDGVQTYRELAAGFDRFREESTDRGLDLPGLKRAPVPTDRELIDALVTTWRDVPKAYPAIPATDDMVGEFIVQTAYFTTRDGKTGRTPAEFVHDFDGLFRATNALMNDAPPEILEQFANQQLERTQGRISRTPAARRFFVWWACAVQARIVQYDFDRHHIAKTASAKDIASEWADLLTTGQRRWPRLPWLVQGFGDFFLDVMSVKGFGQQELWSRFERQLDAADALMARHVTPFGSYEAIIDRRIAEKRGAPNFDPLLRRANALIALAQLLDVARKNGITRFDGNPALLTEQFSLLYDRAKKSFPGLYWEGEGFLEYFLLVQQKQGWDARQTVEHFRPEWSLANALASRGFLRRLEVAAAKAPPELTDQERPLRAFIEIEAQRLEDKTGRRPEGTRSLAMNALIAAASLTLSAGQEGQLPEQAGQPWPKARVDAWAVERGTAGVSDETVPWLVSMIGDFDRLLTAMRSAGPHFPWQSGSVIETTLLVMRNAHATPDELAVALTPTWKAASELVNRGVRVPESFKQLVLEESMLDLRRKIAAARGVPEAAVPDTEVRPDEPELVDLNAKLVLAELVAEVRTKYQETPNPEELAERFVDVRTTVAQRFPHVPFEAKGFAASFLIAAHGPSFRSDPMAYATFIDLPRIDGLLGAYDAASPSERVRMLPPAVLDDVRDTMRRQTGRTPASDRVVTFQALQDGAFLLKEFAPESPVTAENVGVMARLCAGVRRSSKDYPELHIVSTDDQKARVGFSERLAAIAMKQARAQGLELDDPRFVEVALASLEGKFLGTMNTIYDLVRSSFPPEELEYYRETIRQEARGDNARRAQKYGVSADSLSVPTVLDDDVVADLAMYEILYATEIGQGRGYLIDVFQLFDRIRKRPEMKAAFARGLADIDTAFAGKLKKPSEQGYGGWLGDPAYLDYWEQRGHFIKKTRGRLIALSRTFAMVKERAFAEGAPKNARSSFARFGSFEQYVDLLLDDMNRVEGIDGFKTALNGLDAEDPYLADGVLFAFALFKTHVVDTAYPDEQQRMHVVRGISSSLGPVLADYEQVIGFSPRLESGVPLYDARLSFLRRDVHPGGGTAFLRRLGFVQRGVHGWTDKYFIKHAYKVLFHVDLDEDDPTDADAPAANAGTWRGSLDALRRKVYPRTRGDEVKALLESRLPRFLESATGSRNVAAWIDWLSKNGELGLDGRPTGKNTYAEDVSSFEKRIHHYRGLVDAGKDANKNVRGEEQRLRDIGEEYASLLRQVDWLKRDARRSEILTAEARDTYRDAALVHGLGTLGIGLLLGILVYGFWAKSAPKSRLPVRLLRGLLVAAPLAAGVLLPLVVGAHLPLPAWTTPALERLRLIRHDAHDAHDVQSRTTTRGAALQVERSRPWEAFR